MKNEKQIRMLLHPERYTDEQLDKMLDDAHIPVPDVDGEWQHFKARQLGHRRLHQPMRWVAILITVVALSGITYAAIHHLSKAKEEKNAAEVEKRKETMVQRETTKEAEMRVAAIVEERDTIRQDQHFNNVELQQIMKQLCQDFGVKVVFKNEDTRTLRFYLKWQANDSIQDIINRINHFEKVHLSLSDTIITIE